MARTQTLVDVLEAVYCLEGADQPWLASVLDAFAPHLDQGRGVYGFWFDATRPERFRLWDVTVHEDAVVVPDLVAKWHGLLGPREIWDLYSGSKQVAPMRDRLGGGEAVLEHAAMRRFCHSLGILDQLTVRATDPTSLGIAICTPLRALESPSEPQVRSWTKIADHIAAGYRLRRRLATAGDAEDDCDAVLEPDGRCAHAKAEATTADARDALRRGVKAIDRARSRLRREDPGEALEIWRGLIEGRWSLVEHFDSDGRRFVLARRNEPDTPDPGGVTPREAQILKFAALGHSTKEIGYALGLSVSTVSTHLSAAMRKLKVRSRVELVRLLRGCAVEA